MATTVTVCGIFLETFFTKSRFSDVNLCTEKTDICAPGNCVNDPGNGSYLCVCPFGYESLNGTCADINECLEQTICGIETCLNTFGSYACDPSVYGVHQDSSYDINECVEHITVCGRGTCQDLPGSYQCFCPPGFEFTDGICVNQ